MQDKFKEKDRGWVDPSWIVSLEISCFMKELIGENYAKETCKQMLTYLSNLAFSLRSHTISYSFL